MSNFFKKKIKPKIRIILHRVFSLLPGQIALPILRGGLRGRRWILKCGISCWLGNFERPQQIIFEKSVSAGSIIFDIGASVGTYTLLAAELTGPKGRVFSFEPLPENLFYLNKHLRLNHYTNVAVLDMAVSDRSGFGLLKDGGYNTSQWCLSREGSLKVRTVCLDDLVYKEKILPLPDFIKIDVEGAENLVLLGARRLLREAQPTIFLSMHTPDLRRDCLCFLKSLGYNLEPIEQPRVENCAEVLARSSTIKNHGSRAL